MEHPDFYTYNREDDIHIIDYSGSIDLETGLLRIEILDTCFKACAKTNERIKVLMDAKSYKKSSPEVHDKLAKLSRNVFCKYPVKLAVLDSDLTFHMSDNEAWFTDVSSAIHWLKNTP